MRPFLSRTCSKTLIVHWIPRFGIHEDITSDSGNQFTGSLCRKLTNLLGIQPKKTTSKHPQANGMVECFCPPVKNALKARLSSTAGMTELPLVLLGLSSAWREDADCTPTVLVLGNGLRLPGQMFENTEGHPEPTSQFLGKVKERMNQLTTPAPAHHSQPTSYILKGLASAQAMYSSRK